VTAFGTQSPDGAGPGDQARIQFQGNTIIELGDKGGHGSIKLRSQPAIARLNEVWRSQAPTAVGVMTTSSGRAAVAVGGNVLIEVLPGDDRDHDSHVVAQRWADAIAAAFTRSGRAVQLQE
jgi:hypothetical protein